MKFIKIKIKIYFYTRRDEISKISLFFGPGRHAMSVGPKWRDLGVKGRVTIVTDAASLSHLDSDRIKHVSRVGTHRSNEWEGRCGWLSAIHAARDQQNSHF
jgi:hypothetical protein